jgi:uncharacterized damage-inducible protein DinB
MNSVGHLSELFTKTYEGQAWHGPSLMAIIAEITPQQANHQPGHRLHTITELVHHAAYWMKAVRRWITGHEFIPEQADSWGPQGSDAELAWDNAKKSLATEYQELKKAIDAFPEEKLQSLAHEESGLTYYTLINGAIHHNLYHAGQISLLKKLQS